MNSYEARIQAKKERYAKLAQKNDGKADALYRSGREALDLIPLGQPILVDHYSAKSHRAYRARNIAKIEKAFETRKKADYYEAKAESVGTGGISQDDPDAIPKLREKMEKMQAQWDEIKRQRKQGNDAWARGVSTANIRNIKKRIEQLEKAKDAEVQQNIVGNGYTFLENVEANRLQFVFSSIPSEETRKKLKSWGFRWSPTNNAWQAYRSPRGRYSAKRVLEYLNTPTL